MGHVQGKDACIETTDQIPGLLERWRGSISTAAPGRPVQASSGSHEHGPGSPICWAQLGKGIESLTFPACSASYCLDWWYAPQSSEGHTPNK